MSVAEYSDTCIKKPRGRGLAQKSLDLIEAMVEIAREMQPLNGRGVGYKLFTSGLIESMSDMPRVYRLLREARERELLPWEWIVDESRELERVGQWDDPEEYARCIAASYRRDFWNQQPVRVEVWSEKGTVRGVLQPVLDAYGVGFRVHHGYASSTVVHDVAEGNADRALIALYVGDYDPSGLHMSECDLPDRLARYGGDHVIMRRIALTAADVSGLPSFAASDKSKDKRYRWFVENFGNRCWELDAMDPRTLRHRVEHEIEALIEPIAWKRCAAVNRAEQESLRTVLSQWGAAP